MKGIGKRECFLTDMSHLPVSRALMSILASPDSALLREKVGHLWRLRSKKPLRLGPRGRQFESAHPDQLRPPPLDALEVASPDTRCYTICGQVPTLLRRGLQACLTT